MEAKTLTPEDIQKQKEITIFSQEAVDYTTLSPNVGQACANCVFYRASGYDGIDWPHCHLVMGWPKPIEPTGYCKRWEAVPEPTPLDQTPIPVVIVEVETEEMALTNDKASAPKADEVLPTTRKGLVDIIIDTVKSLVQPAKADSQPAFSVFKSASGKKYWQSRHTGKFVDREGEILADKSHEEYVDRVQKGLVPMPELWTWHKKGSRHGQALLVWKSGGFTLAFGEFDDTPEGEQAYRFYEKNEGKIKLSHMFHFPTAAKQNGVYYAYNTIEITTLPDGAEAFPYTSFEGFTPMALTNEQRDFIKGVGGDDMLKRVEAADAKAVSDTKALEALGVEHKGLDNFENATLPAARGDLEALKNVQGDIETRLKAVEDLPAQIKTLTDTVAALKEQVSASQAAESAALTKVNELEKKLLEQSALQPPGSKSGDTLLDNREKSLLETVMAQAKAEGTPSLVEQMIGGQSTIATGEGK